METLTHNGIDFTFERVDSINELPRTYSNIMTDTHDAALIYWKPKYSRHITYYEQKSTGGRIYAFTKGE